VAILHPSRQITDISVADFFTIYVTVKLKNKLLRK